MARRSVITFCSCLALLSMNIGCAALSNLSTKSLLSSDKDGSAESATKKASADDNTSSVAQKSTARKNGGARKTSPDGQRNATPDKAKSAFEGIPSGLAVSAKAGAPNISLKTASWCGGDARRPFDWDRKKVEHKYKRFIKKVEDPKKKNVDMTAFAELGRFVCKDSGPGRLSWLQSYMQAVANKHGIPTHHQEVLLTAAVTVSDAMRFQFDPPKGVCDSEKLSKNRVEAAKQKLMRAGRGCDRSPSINWWMWDLDRGPQLKSAIETVGWVNAVYSRTKQFAYGAVSMRDAKRLDVDQYMSEIDQLGLGDNARALAVLHAYDAKRAFTDWQAVFKDKLGGDYDDLLKVADDGYAGWLSEYETYKAAADSAYQVEDAFGWGDKRKLKDCAERTHNHMVKYLKDHSIKSEQDVKAAMSKPMGGLLARAALECHRASGSKIAAVPYAALLERGSTTRGPRYAALAKLSDKVSEIRKENSRFPLSQREFNGYSPREGFGMDRPSHGELGSGVVLNTQTRGDKVEVTFKSTTRQHPVMKCRTTHRIDRITSSGKVVYKRICKQVGNKTVVVQEKPVTISANLLGGLKRGSFLTFARQRKQQPGATRLVFASEKRERLLNFYGIEL